MFNRKPPSLSDDNAVIDGYAKEMQIRKELQEIQNLRNEYYACKWLSSSSRLSEDCDIIKQLYTDLQNNLGQRKKP